MPSLRIIYASTSGHTEYVATELARFLGQRLPGLTVALTRVESATPDDLTSSDVLLLASGT